MKKFIINLIEYCFTHGIAMNKTKSKKGFMIYNHSQVTDVQELSALAQQCNWKVIETPPEWDKGKQVSPGQFYVGPVKSDFDLTDKDAARQYLLDQISD
jgi:hypothetical protein